MEPRQIVAIYFGDIIMQFPPRARFSFPRVGSIIDALNASVNFQSEWVMVVPSLALHVNLISFSFPLNILWLFFLLFITLAFFYHFSLTKTLLSNMLCGLECECPRSLSPHSNYLRDVTHLFSSLCSLRHVAVILCVIFISVFTFYC